MVQALWEVLRSGDLQPIDGMGKGKVRVEWMLLCKRCVCVCVCGYVLAFVCYISWSLRKFILIVSLSLSLSLSLSPPPSLPPSLPPSVCDKQNFYKKANHSSWIIYKGEKRPKKKEKNNAINSSLYNQSSKSNVDVSSFMPMLSPSKKIHKKECSSA